jgi:hypothetical protein
VTTASQLKQLLTFALNVVAEEKPLCIPMFSEPQLGFTFSHWLVAKVCISLEKVRIVPP